MTPQKYDYIDALRGLAILGVFLTHLHQHINISPTLLLGQFGVQLFFLVSAYTLCLSLTARNTMESKRKKQQYFTRRFFRIAPLYYAAIISYLLYDMVFPIDSFPNFEQMRWKGAILNFLFFHGFSRTHISTIPPGGWSIAAEMTFYLILPIVFLKIRSLGDSIKWFFYSLIIYFSTQMLGQYYISNFSRGGAESWPNESGWFFYMWFPSQFPVFTLGILAHFLLRERQDLVKKYLYIFIILIPASLCISYILTVTEYSTILSFQFTHLIISLGFFSFLLLLALYPKKVIVNPALVQLGKISFSVYLVHFLMLDLADHFVDYFQINSGILYVSISVFGTLMVSILTYNWIEKSGIKIGKKFIKKYLPAKQS